MATADWTQSLPTLTSRSVTLREAAAHDAAALVDVLSTADASRFGLDFPIDHSAVHEFIDRTHRERAAGLSFTYVVVTNAAHQVGGVVQVRRLDPAFEAGEWECTLAPSIRGTGAFLDTARLVAAFAFGTAGAYRLEARVLLHNGRANGALRKLGAVQEGILRRAVRCGDEYVDQVLWSLLKDEWKERRGAVEPRVH